jgi:uncharacterized C2H2 Zn-finger protein
MNDFMVFHDGMRLELDEGERVEADDIYSPDAPKYVKCPKCIAFLPEKLAMTRRVQGRHEILNNKIKHWNCLVYPFKCKGSASAKLKKHNALFRSCAVAIQVSMELGIGELYVVGDYV